MTGITPKIAKRTPVRDNKSTQKFAVFSEELGSRIIEVRIPLNMIGDPERSLEYAKQYVDPSEVMMTDRDAKDAALEVLEGLSREGLKDKVVREIRFFVNKNYGKSEMNNPSWDIKALAEHLTKNL